MKIIVKKNQLKLLLNMPFTTTREMSCLSRGPPCLYGSPNGTHQTLPLFFFLFLYLYLVSHHRKGGWGDYILSVVISNLKAMPLSPTHWSFNGLLDLFTSHCYVNTGITSCYMTEHRYLPNCKFWCFMFSQINLKNSSFDGSDFIL